MKRKTFIAILAIAMVLVLSLAVLTACNNKKHDFSSKWEYDETSHWHECMTKKHSDVADKADHTFDAGIVTTPPTEDAAGVKTLTCTVCGYQKTESVPQLGHTFDMERWASDAQTHWHPATCAHTDLKKDEAEHTWNEGVVIKPADYGVVGTKKFTCTVCGYEKTEDIDALGAKDNEIVLVTGKTLGKEYDGEAISITKEDFVIAGNREPAFMFKVKGADDNTYAATAPTNVGEYTVKISVAATAEWKAASNTFDFAIAKKSLTATATKTYDGNATMPATLTGVVAGETVTATITMTSKNVGATVKEVMLAGADKDNYTLTAANINASITPMTIGVDWDHSYNNSNIITGEPAELLDGDEAMITVTMESANVGAAVKSFEITGKDAANYSLAREDVNVKIVKADIVKFTISNASAFEKGFYVGATNIPEPTTDYDEIGTGYGERTIVWEMQLEGDDISFVATDAPLKIALPKDFFAKAKQADVFHGKKVVLGLRAEHISIDAEKYTAKAKIKVSHIEELGTESQVFGDLNFDKELGLQSSTKIVIKAPTMTRFEVGSVTEISFDIENIQVFDAETETNMIPRIPDCSSISVVVKNHTVEIGSSRIELPSAFSMEDGNYKLTIPVDAVEKGNYVVGTVKKVEEVNGKYLHYVETGGQIIFALFDEETSGEITLGIDLKKVTCSIDDKIVHEAIPAFNTLSGKMLRQRNKDKRTFKEIVKSAAIPKFSFETMGHKFECTRELASKLVGIGGTKIIGKALSFEFSPQDVEIATDGIPFSVEKILDYGTERYAKCERDGVVLYAKVGGDFNEESIDIVLPVDKMSIFDVEDQIRLK